MIGIINPWQPINLSHPLNRGLVACWQSIPGYQRSSVIRDLCRHNDPHDLDLNIGSDSVAGKWSGASRHGGLGEWSFDGTSDFFEAVTVPKQIQNLSKLTVSAWIKTTASGQYLVEQWRGGSGQHFTLVWGFTAGKAQFYVANGGIPSSGASSQSIDDGVWHMITGVYDEIKVYIYVDGVEGNSSANTTPLITTTTAPLRIGNVDGPLHFDDVRIYDRGLSASEVRQLYYASQERLSPLLNRIDLSGRKVGVAAGGPWPHHMDNYDLSGNFSGLGL